MTKEDFIKKFPDVKVQHFQTKFAEFNLQMQQNSD